MESIADVLLLVAPLHRLAKGPMPGPVTVYLCLGSNMGSRQTNIDIALGHLAERMRIVKKSSSYDTTPVGVNGPQPRYLNVVVEATTFLPADGVLMVGQAVESKLGRVPLADNGPQPRPIDVDILFYGNQVISQPKLTIPHPRLSERAFVLFPLAEIAPDLVHPVLKRTTKDLLREVGGKEGVLKVGR